VVKITPDQDHSLKLTCLEIASREALETKGFIKQAELMKRAQQLYVAAKIAGFDTWNLPSRSAEETAQPIIKEETVIDSSQTKICPNCGEAIPIKFKVHKFKATGEKCGQRFD
jgi:hypothetical protein